MKRTSLLAVMLALAFTLEANHLSSTLIIRSENHPVIIRLDRSSATSGAAMVHRLDHLPPGRHFVEVYDLPPYHPGHGHAIGRLLYRGYAITSPGLASIYRLNRYKLVLQEQRPLAAASPCGVHGYGPCACAPPPRPPHCATGSWHPVYSPPPCPVCGLADDYYGGHSQCYDHAGISYGQYGHPSPAPHHGHQGVQPMSDREFRDLVRRMDDEITDASKVAAVSLYLGNRKLCTDQVREMMQLLSFDKQKLELAMAIFPNVTDPQHYDELTSEFYFTTYRRQLDAFIAEARQGL